MKPHLLTCCLLFLASCHTHVTNPAPPPLVATGAPTAHTQTTQGNVEAKATLAAVGDLLMHGMVKQSAVAANQKNEEGKSSNHDGYGALFKEITPLIQSADYAFANLETPVAPKNNKGTRSMVFNVSASLLPALSDSGFDLVSMANNHVYDQGRKGLTETLEHLDESELDYIGAGKTCAEARQPHLTSINGISVAFIGATRLFNNNLNETDEKHCSFLLEPAQAIESVQAAREAGAEFVVLSLHWGREYRTKPQSEAIELAHTLLDNGVDLILGHHAHVLQPIEIYETKDGRKGVVAYSLGNFISNQSAWYQYKLHGHEHGNTRDGIVLFIDLLRVNYGKGPGGEPMIRTELANIRAIPTWTINKKTEQNGKRRPYIRVVETHRLRRFAQEQLKTETNEKEMLQLKKNIELYNTRMRQVARILGYGFIAQAPTPEPTTDDDVP